MNLVGKLKQFALEDSGQTTTEYILILAVIVTIFMQFKKKLLAIIGKLFTGLDQATDSAMSEMGSSEGG